MAENSQSLLGMMKEVARGSVSEILACTVTRTNPLQLKFQGDTKTVIDRDALIIPDHVKLTKNCTAYIMQSGDSFFVLGKEG